MVLYLCYFCSLLCSLTKHRATALKFPPCSIQLTVFLTAAIQFQILSPPNQGDERHPGVINVPIQVTLVPVTSVLQTDVAVFISVLGGTATGKKLSWFCVDRT